jgi:UDP-2,3-diacylglucosamine pyrophosphatase LpxH
MRPLKYRSIWISDVHLGSKDCKASFLLDFLKSTDCEYLYLVGDIVDLWAMKRGLFWPQQHNDVIRTILGKAKHGTKVIYIPGNHDDPIRDYHGMAFGNVEIRKEHIHTTADGRRLLLMHGDQFDSAIHCGKLATFVGERAYDVLLCLNRLVNHMRRTLGFPYWSLAAYLKHRVKNAVKHIKNFECAVAHEAHKREVDGLVCGHIHHAEITQLNGVIYCNDGDWVESCTALVENHDGSLQLVHWADEKLTMKSIPMVEYDTAKKIA